MPSALKPLLVFTGFLAFFLAVHARPGGQTERDGYFHARFAASLPARGLSRSFPWLKSSAWNDSFNDKEFLFHLLLAPLSRGQEPIRGAAAASSLIAAAVFTAFFLFLSQSSAPLPLAWTLLLAGIGGPFLLRLSFVRAHVLSIFLFVVGMHLLSKNRPRALAALGFFYSWTYSFPLVLPVFAFAYCIGRRLFGHEPQWKLFGACFLGVGAGLIIHPYFPLSIGSLWTHLQILALAAGRRSLAAVEVAREFAPYGTKDFLLAYPGLVLASLWLGASGWRFGQKASAETAGFLTAAAGGILATMSSARMIEYAAPLAVAAAAFCAKDMLKGEKPQSFPAVGLFVLSLGLFLHSTAYTIGMSAGEPPPRFQNAAVWMEENLKEGETVVNLAWDDFPELYYSAPRQRFVWGIDPTFSLIRDKETTLRLERMRTGREPIDFQWLAQKFDARILAIRREAAVYYPQLDPRNKPPLYEDTHALLYELLLESPKGR